MKLPVLDNRPLEVIYNLSGLRFRIIGQFQGRIFYDALEPEADERLIFLTEWGDFDIELNTIVSIREVR